MKTINLLFAVHNHQPVGNFDRVFREGWEKCYGPFLAALEKHPRFRISLHYSGSLLEWLEANQPDFIARLRTLVNRGQVELISGGFYEPLLPFIPEKDAIGQVLFLNQYLQKKINSHPRGLWLAERVWCTTLPKTLSATGLTYTLVDDSHFRFAGLPQEEMFGYYVTEHEGNPLSLFPINQQLRYAIPFRNPGETVEALRFWATEEGNFAVTYADDGEKFGLWPGTYHWVIEENWLEKFIRALEENHEWVHLLTFSEYMAKYPPQGRIYLPPSSYEEMMQWALPPVPAIAFADLVAELKTAGRFEKFRPFLRGGSWENFLVKYPESNQMHKKMLYTSAKAHRALGKTPPPPKEGKDFSPPPILQALWRGQSNNAYWHGLFGGLYLHHLRHAVYKNLIAAEKQAEILEGSKKNFLRHEILDFDMDLAPEILVTSSGLEAVIKPGYGGALIELDFRPRESNLTNALTRRPEAYHRRLKTPGNSLLAKDLVPPDFVPAIDGGLADVLMYDWYNRYSFLDHFLGEETTFEQFRRCQYPELGNFINQPYELVDVKELEKSKSLAVRLRRRGGLWKQEGKIPTELVKRFIFHRDQDTLEAEYDIINRSPGESRFWFGVELNLTPPLGGGNRPAFFLPEAKETDLPLELSGAIPEIESLGMRDEGMGIALSLDLAPMGDLWHFPLETVSQSEKGLEKTVQGNVLLFTWRFSLRPGEKKRIYLRLSCRSAG
jgi:4-alpha-glucanotransferase